MLKARSSSVGSGYPVCGRLRVCIRRAGSGTVDSTFQRGGPCCRQRYPRRELFLSLGGERHPGGFDGSGCPIVHAPPAYPDYVAGLDDTAGYTTTNFLLNHGLQIAINANNFHDPGTPNSESPSYTEPEGSPFAVDGLAISQGQVVATPNAPTFANATFMFTTNNQASFIATNWPAQSWAGIYTAAAGLYAILVNGRNVGSNYITDSSFVHTQNPRTLFGLSGNRRYLYLVAIDGRQDGYSIGCYDWEAADWLLLMGAWNGANMDGGGLTCLVAANSAGQPVPLNQDSASAAGYGQERTVGSHFGVYAKPVPGFFNDVQALPGETAATITWTTSDPATTQVKYGLTTNFTFATALDAAMVTNHAVLLTNLSPGTGYYFAALSQAGATLNVSSNFFFTTTNYLTTNALFDLTNVWTYMTADLDGVNWTAPTYDDSSWDGSGPGVLWVDTSGSPAQGIPSPLTQMPDPGTGYPYITYYLRTHFEFTNQLSGVALVFEAYVDNGAVFYLNGTEIYRLRMPAAPEPILNSTLAVGYPCDGYATCPDDFSISGQAIATNLVAGDNVMAAEVHMDNPLSTDITFGLALSYTEPYTLSPALNVQVVPEATAATITWTTSDPATTQVEYGLTTNLTLASALDTTLVTNHTVLLTNLSPGTGYYFAALSIIDGTLYLSSNFFFTTLSSQPLLNLGGGNGTWTLSWTGDGFTVQQANTPIGPWVDAPGLSSVSPYTLTNLGPALFFRLRK